MILTGLLIVSIIIFVWSVVYKSLATPQTKLYDRLMELEHKAQSIESESGLLTIESQLKDVSAKCWRNKQMKVIRRIYSILEEKAIEIKHKKERA